MQTHHHAYPTAKIMGFAAHSGWSAAFSINGTEIIVTAADAEHLASACNSLGLKLDKPHEMHGVYLLHRREVDAAEITNVTPKEDPIESLPAVDDGGQHEAISSEERAIDPLAERDYFPHTIESGDAPKDIEDY